MRPASRQQPAATKTQRNVRGAVTPKLCVTHSVHSREWVRTLTNKMHQVASQMSKLPYITRSSDMFRDIKWSSVIRQHELNNIAQNTMEFDTHVACSGQTGQSLRFVNPYLSTRYLCVQKYTVFYTIFACVSWWPKFYGSKHAGSCLL